jgi:hypothetical protein
VKEGGKNERQVKMNYNIKRNTPTEIRYREGKIGKERKRKKKIERMKFFPPIFKLKCHE